MVSYERREWGGGVVVGKVFLGQRRVHCVFLCVKSLSSL